MVDYTLVVGVDRKHLEQLSHTWPSWITHKPSLLDVPMLVFHDHVGEQAVTEREVRSVLRRPHLKIVPWPADEKIIYGGDPKSKWFHPQRYKMLAGFVHVTATHVSTPYWLKLDTDVVATGKDDWIDKRWFRGDPAIVCQKWHYTKPPNQMIELDAWVKENRDAMSWLASRPPLNLVPEPDANKVKHERIISWCGFFSTALTKYISEVATGICGEGMLPVPSQDGYVWYMAKRMGHVIRRVDMRSRGWQQWSSMLNVKIHAARAIEGEDVR